MINLGQCLLPGFASQHGDLALRILRAFEIPFQTRASVINPPAHSSMGARRFALRAIPTNRPITDDGMPWSPSSRYFCRRGHVCHLA